MNLKRLCSICLLVTVTIFLFSCARPEAPEHKRPATFVEKDELTWSIIPVRNNLSYDQAWAKTVSLISRDWNIDLISKEDGLIRTQWRQTWDGDILTFYKVRVKLKFIKNGEQLRFLTEAWWLASPSEGIWIRGSDRQQAKTLRKDLMGVLGRTSTN